MVRFRLAATALVVSLGSAPPARAAGPGVASAGGDIVPSPTAPATPSPARPGELPAALIGGNPDRCWFAAVPAG